MSVANLTRADADAFMQAAAEVPPVVQPVAYALAKAHQALDNLRAGRFSGAAVLQVSQQDFRKTS